MTYYALSGAYVNKFMQSMQVFFVKFYSHKALII